MPKSVLRNETNKLKHYRPRRTIHGSIGATYENIGQWPLLDFFELKHSPLTQLSDQTVTRTRIVIAKADAFAQKALGRVCRLEDVDGDFLTDVMQHWLEAGDAPFTVIQIPKLILPVLRAAMDFHHLPHRRLKVQRPAMFRRPHPRREGGPNEEPPVSVKRYSWLKHPEKQPLLDGAPDADYPEIGQWPVRDYFERRYLLRNARLAAGSPRSIDAVRCELRKFCRFFAATRGNKIPTLADVDANTMNEAIAWSLRQGASIPTALKLPRHVLAIVRAAIERDSLPWRPLKIDKPRQDKIEPKTWTQAEVDRLLLAACNFRLPGMPRMMAGVRTCDLLTAILLTVTNTGVRITALMNTPTSCWDREKMLLRIPAGVQKQRQDQVFNLFPQTNAFLQRIQPPPNGCLFDRWTRDRGRPEQWRSLTRCLKWCLVFAGLADDVQSVDRRKLFHCLRRFFATMVAVRAGIAEARRQLGHSAEWVTTAYIDQSQLPHRRTTELLTAPTFCPETVPPLQEEPTDSPEEFYGL